MLSPDVYAFKGHARLCEDEHFHTCSHFECKTSRCSFLKQLAPCSQESTSLKNTAALLLAWVPALQVAQVSLHPRSPQFRLQMQC